MPRGAGTITDSPIWTHPTPPARTNTLLLAVVGAGAVAVISAVVALVSLSDDVPAAQAEAPSPPVATPLPDEELDDAQPAAPASSASTATTAPLPSGLPAPTTVTTRRPTTAPTGQPSSASSRSGAFREW
jgi:hypothetical protein